jgi:hypothetical protein
MRRGSFSRVAVRIRQRTCMHAAVHTNRDLPAILYYYSGGTTMHAYIQSFCFFFSLGARTTFPSISAPTPIPSSSMIHPRLMLMIQQARAQCKTKSRRLLHMDLSSSVSLSTCHGFITPRNRSMTMRYTYVFPATRS